MAVAIISTLISSIALMGVAASLLLQARQLRASQVQASRAAQIELIKMAVDNKELISDIFGDEPGSYLKARCINWFFKYLELGYSMKVISEKSVRVQAMMLFDTDYPYEWWIRGREVWEIEADTKRDRNFFRIVDNAFLRATEQRQAGGSSGSQATQA